MLQKNIIKKYIKNHLDSDKITELYQIYTATFHNPEKIQHIKDSKEEQYQEGFLRDLFCDILGYTINPEPNFNLITEKKNESDSRKADGAIIIDGKVQAVIELKGCDTTDLSKVENQAFGYKAHNPTANLVIISNFAKLRLYIEDASDFLEFNIFTMNQEQFELLYLCLSLENVKSNIPQKLKNESVSAEIDITDKLYADYSTFKRALFENICELNLEGESLPLASKAETAFSATPSSGDTPQRPVVDKLTLFKKTQKLLDRILFVLFCEDRGLLPENSVAKIIAQWQKLKELDAYQPLYTRFQNYFNHINTGYKSETDPSYVIFAYNGGLFKPDEILDNIKISDDVLFIHTRKLSQYDFESEVSVDILGHIFEHSLTEIEEIQEEIANASGNKEPKNSDKTTSKRKKDGVFYTPAYITKYIVENTIGKLCDDKKTELGINDETFAEKRRNKNQKAELDEKLKTYRKWLLSLKICDPACGSGAFLNAALQFLKAEHALIDELNAKLYGDLLVFQEVENAILENNLYGVDINEESVEIAKLSLWLHTAQKGRKLSTLNNNIKCGNSLIDDVEIAGEKAFCWEKEFPEVFGEGGFDVVIGNPPYGAKLLDIEKQFIEKKYSTFEYQVNSYVIFYEKALFLLKENGILGFITPSTFTYQHYFDKLRSFLQNYTQLLVCKYTYEVFKDANIGDSVSWIIKKSKNLKTPVLCHIKENEISTEKAFFLDYDRFVLFDKTYSINDNSLNFNKINIDAVSLTDITNVIVGIKAYQVGKGLPKQTEEIVKNKVFTATLKIDDTYIKCVIGKDFHRYKYISEPSMYISYGKWLAEPRDGAPFFDEEKIILRQTSDSLIANIDVNRYINLNNVYNIGVLNKDFSLKYILTLLNSNLFDYIYKSISQEKGRVFPEVKKVNLAKLPIKNISLAEQQPFIDLADKMLTLNADLQKSVQRFLKRVQENLNPAKISSTLESFYTIEFADFVKELAKQKVKLTLKQQDEWEEYFAEYKKDCQALSEEIAATDNEINRLVYKLYDLTDEEIAVVEGR